MKRTIKRIVVVVSMAFVVTSCAVIKPYERPQVVDESIYRTDKLPTDSISSAVVPWREIFTDNLLQSYITKALENNLDIRVAIQNIEISQSYLKQGRSSYLPTFSLTTSYTRGTSSLNTASGKLQAERTYANQWDLLGNASWETDVWGKINSQWRAYRASYLGTIASHQAVKSEVVATLATAYYQLMMYDTQKQILEETIALRQESLATTKALKEAGSATEVAVQQTEALYYNAQAQLITIKNAIWALENTISVLLGEEPRAIERGLLSAQQFPAEFNHGYAVSLLENRPDVRQAETNFINAFELTNVAKTNFYPSFTLTARGGFSSENLDNWFDAKSIVANFVAGLTQPILNKRQIRTQYEVSQANKEIALLNFKKVLLSAGKEVSDALQNYQSQDEFITLKTKEMESYQKATEYSRELFNSGMASYLEVITAEVNRLNAELSVANAQFTRMQYGITLYKALGGGWR